VLAWIRPARLGRRCFRRPVRILRFQARLVRPRRGASVGRTGALALLASAVAWAGIAPAARSEVEETPRLTAVERVRLVLLPTSVTTRRGKPVRGLEPQDFRLYEDGVPRQIDLFATEENAPIALAFLLDVSGSMRLRDRLDEAKRAIRYFVETLDEDDRVGLIGFADGRVEWITGFDRDRATFLERLDVQRPAGRTALYDALAASPHLVDEEIRGRKAIVLITDGVDNASTLSRLQATWMARRVAVPIYTLSFIPIREALLPYRAREALRVLERFSVETGGTLFPVHGARDLDRAARQIRGELRFQYVIGFYPAVGDWDGSFRVLRLTTGRDGLRVRTRRGYYADP
jgi:Ca-activated chloride channel family protein